MYIDPRRAAVWLAWVFVFAHSFTPFDFVFESGRLVTSFTASEPFDAGQLVSLIQHLLVFAIAGATDRITVSPASGRLIAKHVLARGVVLCLIVEIGQELLPVRHAEVIDLVVNVTGLLIGHLAAAVVAPLAARAARPWLRGRRVDDQRLRPILLAAWALFWGAMLVLPGRLVLLNDWDRGYPLVVAGASPETFRSDGEVEYVAIYERALDPDRVRWSFDTPPRTGAGSTRERLGLLAAYDFTRGGEYGVVARGVAAPALGPTPAPAPGEERAETAAGGMSPAFTSTESADVLAAAMTSHAAFTVEIWRRPTALDPEEGPRPLVGIIGSPWRRNFSIVRSGADLFFRVRNGLTGPDGGRFQLRAPYALAAASRQIVATYDRGVSTLYANGEQRGPIADLREPSVMMRLRAGVRSRIATAFLAALSFLLLAGRHDRKPVTVVDLLGMCAVGCGCLLLPIAAARLFSYQPAVSLLVWFPVGFVVTSALVLRVNRS